MPRRAVIVLLLLGSVTAGAGERRKHGTLAEAKAMLEEAVVMILEQGERASLEEFNRKKGRFVQRDLYVFCFGPDDKVTAHPTLVGTDVKTMTDADGKLLGQAFTAAAVMEDGAVEYRTRDAQAEVPSTKIAFVRRANAQVCSVSALK